MNFEPASTPVVKIEENPSLSAEQGNKNLNNPLILIILINLCLLTDRISAKPDFWFSSCGRS